jgi:hypothetical protein
MSSKQQSDGGTSCGAALLAEFGRRRRYETAFKVPSIIAAQVEAKHEK